MERTWKPTTAGILSVIAGAMNVILGIVFAILGVLAGMGLTFLGVAWGVVVPSIILLGIIAIVGGIYALRGRIWGLALAGSICALFGPAGFLGIPAIIFVIRGKREFE